MILSFAPQANLGPASLALAGLAMLGYGLAAWPVREGSRRAIWGLATGWLAHAGLLALDIGGWGRDLAGARLGFGPVLSLTVWLVLAVHAVESRFVPLPAVRRLLAVAGGLAVLLACLFPGEVRASLHAWAPVHWVLGVASYALFGAAVLHASMLDSAERALRRRHSNAAPAWAPGMVVGGAVAGSSGALAAGTGLPGAARGPMGLPLLRLERLTFRFVEAGFLVLTLALVLGAVSAVHWRWDHKSVFSLLGWAVFAALLAGRYWRGWRGRRATRWLYLGTALLLLAYAGSRFVFEVVLGRGVV